MGQAMMHSHADDPLLFCEAPNAVPWSHLFDLDSRHPTCYTVKNCLPFIVSGPWTMVVPWNWNLDPGCPPWWLRLFIFVRHPNKKMKRCRKIAAWLKPLSDYCPPPLIQQQGLALWQAHIALRSWTSLLSEALLIGADVTARCRELSK